MLKRVLIMAALVMGVLGCGTTDERFVKDGVNYAQTEGVFRGRWWSYYERGGNLARGEFYDAAEADLRKALDGRSRDAWQARTYGLHFTEYFPNRELGVVLFHQGQLEEAEQFILRSLEQVDTARGHYYLDLIKREQIARGVISDTTTPELAVSVEDGAIISERALAFDIAANDDVGVSSTRVNGRSLYQRGSKEEVSYSDEILFVEGTHEITVETADLADKVSTKTVKVTVDLTGPNVGIREPEDALITEAATVPLAGTAVDALGVVSVDVDGQSIATGAGAAKLAFETTLNLQAGENSFILTATDAAGNKTHTAINVFRGNQRAAEARLWRIAQRSPEKLKTALANGASLMAIIQSLEAAQEETPVSIRLKSPAQDRPWRNDLAVRIAGEVVATTEVAEVVVNGESFEPLPGEPKLSFNKRLPLDDQARQTGSTTVKVTVVAADGSGNQATEEVTVQVQPVDIDTRESKMPVAVLAFGGAADESLRTDLRTLTETTVFQTDRFNVVERQELQAVLTEQQLSDALGDPQAALQLGKVIPAHAFIVADVIQRGTEAEVLGRVVQTETGEQIVTVDTHVENTEDLDKMREACTALAEELKRKLPRIGGELLGVQGTRFLINWGHEDGVITGMHVWIVHQTEPFVDDSTGEVLDEGETVKLGEAVISNVKTNTTAEQIQREGDATFEAGMATITM